jgi:diguanylate cyclase (GGDEF)-like protein/PAS domain S-box-containing protein
MEDQYGGAPGMSEHKLAMAESVYTEAHVRSLVLEMMVAGAPLPRIVETLLLGLETQRPGALCTLMLLDAQGQFFERVLAPSMPHFYSAALVGLAIGEGRGSCGTAAATGRQVVVEDIASHPYWADYKELASQAGVAACWSQPVQSASGRILGTFAIYYRERRAPDATDLVLIQQCAALACIAIERDTEAQQLRDSEARYRTLVECSPDAILVHHLGNILYVNPAAVRTFGAQSADDLLGRNTRSLVHPDWLEQQTARMQAINSGAAPVAMAESRFLRLDGTPFDVEVQGTAIPYQGQSAIQVVLRDITERKQARDRLQLAASVFSHAREGIVMTDADTMILDVNAAFTSITGYSREEVLGQQASAFRYGAHSQHYLDVLWLELRQKGFWSGEMWRKRKNGEDYAEMVTISAVTDAAGMVRNYVLLLADITPMKTYQQQLEELAHFDTLTHLPNRLLLADRLQQAMSQSQRRQQTLAVVFVDLDGFKTVNDHYGHSVGDELLLALSLRMKGALREGDTLARIGGDEFVAVLVDLQQPEDAQPVLQRLLLAAADPVPLSGEQIQVSASMGIALYPRDGAHADLLLRRADQAMYLAKQAGRNRYQFFSEVAELPPAA